MSLFCSEGGFIERCAKNYETASAVPISGSGVGSGSISDGASSPGHAAVDGCGSGDNSILIDEKLVTIRLVADEQGRFGFNVRGGVDLKLPVLVSRVAPHTPADRTVPRICEGDQVVMINGRDVNGLMHEQVVALIRASREFRSGELVLTVKPNGLCYNLCVKMCVFYFMFLFRSSD